MVFGRRTSLIAGATTAALLVVAVLGWRSYASIRVDEATRLARRQQVLAGTMAIAIASEIDSWRTQLRQLNGLPSIQYVTEDALAGRLADLFPRQDLALVEIVRYSSDGRLLSWMPTTRTIRSESELQPTVLDGLMTWSRDVRERDRTTSVLFEDADGTLDVVIATPTYETAIGNEQYQNPSGTHAGLLAFRLDIDRLVSPYVNHALDASPESTAVVLVSPGRAAYWRAAADAVRHEGPGLSPERWPELLAIGEGSSEGVDAHGHSAIASWAPVPGFELPLVVWLDQSSDVAQQAVWPVLLRQAPMFALVVGSMLTLAWALQRSYRSEERYRALVTHAADGIVVLSPDGAILDINPAGTRLAGLAPREALGHNRGADRPDRSRQVARGARRCPGGRGSKPRRGNDSRRREGC